VGSCSGTVLSRFRHTLLSVAMIAASVQVAAQPAARTGERGKALYQERCAVCHGDDGRPDTPVGRLLQPRPRNFADPVEMARVSPDRMYKSIRDGRPGTAMAPWKLVLGETQIGDLIDYVRGFAAAGAKDAPTGVRLSIEVGRRIYERECASCHGKDGNADTDIAMHLTPPPRDFTDPIGMARLDDGRMYLAIYRGRPGTAMGGRGEQLSGLEIIDVIRYVRSLTRPLPAGVTAQQLDLRVGELIYRQYCAVCHGDNGDGNSALGQHLMPRPRNFTSRAEMGAHTNQTLADAIARGVPGTSMAPWEGVLFGEDVRRVVYFIRQTFWRP
jgi:mono/diheme cytochrome c family protein